MVAKRSWDVLRARTFSTSPRWWRIAYTPHQKGTPLPGHPAPPNCTLSRVAGSGDDVATFVAQIVDPIMHRECAYTLGKRPCRLTVNMDKRCLTRHVDAERVTINIDALCGLERDNQNPNALYLISGTMQEKWQLLFQNPGHRQKFYQALLPHNPFGWTDELKPTNAFVFVFVNT